MTRLSLISSAMVLLFTATTHAQISNGFEAQVRLQSGEMFVTSFLNQANTGSLAAPYIPATPYGYVGYKLESGLSFGLGLGFVYYNYNNNIPNILVYNNGWALMVAPTLQVPFMRGEHYELFGVGRFILGAGKQWLERFAVEGRESTVFGVVPNMSYGGNLGLGGTWYPIGCFGIGAEVGGGVNYLTGDTYVQTPQGNQGPWNVNALYVQTYFSLNANYIF